MVYDTDPWFPQEDFSDEGEQFGTSLEDLERVSN